MRTRMHLIIFMNETMDMIANCVFQNNGRINEQFQLMKLNF